MSLGRICWCFANFVVAVQYLKSVQIRSFFCSVFSCIRNEHGDLRPKCLYAVRIQENLTRRNSVFGRFSRSNNKRAMMRKTVLLVWRSSYSIQILWKGAFGIKYSHCTKKWSFPLRISWSFVQCQYLELVCGRKFSRKKDSANIFW